MQLGIVGTEYSTRDDTFFGTQISYLRYMEQFGNPEIITPYVPLEKMLALDGIFLPGGPDIDPRRYGAKVSAWTSRSSQFLEFFDTEFLPSLIGNVPLIGICRGLQTINVALGGTLNQHLYGHSYSTFEDDLVHEVFTKDNKKFKVNSFHHQGIDSLSDNLLPLVTDKKGLIEAAWSEELKIFAVQWHPERMIRDPFSELYINKILKGE